MLDSIKVMVRNAARRGHRWLSSSDRLGVITLLTAVAFVGSAGAAAIGVIPRPPIDVEINLENRGEVESDYQPSYEFDSGRQIVLVFFGSSTCRASQGPGLRKLIRTAKASVQAQARENGADFITIGVALDWRADRGIEFLEDFGVFDELSSGRSWSNSLALRYLWGAFPGRGATPQLVVVERKTVTPFIDGELKPGASYRPVNYDATDIRILRRRVGVNQIQEWVAAGAKVTS